MPWSCDVSSSSKCRLGVQPTLSAASYGPLGMVESYNTWWTGRATVQERSWNPGETYWTVPSSDGSTRSVRTNPPKPAIFPSLRVGLLYHLLCPTRLTTCRHEVSDLGTPSSDKGDVHITRHIDSPLRSLSTRLSYVIRTSLSSGFQTDSPVIDPAFRPPTTDYRPCLSPTCLLCLCPSDRPCLPPPDNGFCLLPACLPFARFCK